MPESLLDQWRAVSFEKKITAFVAPVVAGVVLLAIGRVFPENPQAVVPPPTSQPATAQPVTPVPPTVQPASAATQPTRRPEELEIVRVSVLDPVDEDGKPPIPPSLDITLRNVGETVAIITGADLTVIDDARISNCEPVTGGPLGVTYAYGVSMPVDPEPNAVFTTPMSQSIAPNEADRIAIAIDAPEFDWSADAAVLYAFRIDLRSGPDEDRVPVGDAVVSFPYVPAPGSFPGWFADMDLEPDVQSCLEDNEATLRRFLQVEGAKPAALTEDLLKPEP